MIKKLSFLFAMSASLLGFSQTADTNTITKSTTATDELVISTNGFFLNKLPGGGYEPATLTITSVSDFRTDGAGNEPTHAKIWLPIKNPGATGNAFVITGGLSDANTTSTSLDANPNDGNSLTVRTRTWVLSQLNIGDESLIAVGTGYSLRVSGGGPLTIDKFSNTDIEVVPAYYPPNYISITNEQTAFASVTRGETFTMSFNYTANTNITGLNYRILLVHPAGADPVADPYTNATISNVTADDIVVSGTEENQSGTITFTFPEEEVLNGLNVGTTADNGSGVHKLNGDDYYGMQKWNGSGWDWISYSLEFPVINDATLSTGNFSKAGISITQNFKNGTLQISDVSDIETIFIKNVLGQTVKTFRAQKSINISSLPSGVYFIQTNNGLRQKIVHQ